MSNVEERFEREAKCCFATLRLRAEIKSVIGTEVESQRVPVLEYSPNSQAFYCIFHAKL